MGEDRTRAAQVGRWAVAALGILKAITLGIALEQGVLAAWEIAVEVALIAGLAVVFWQLSLKPARHPLRIWIAVAIAAYVLEIAVFAAAEPKSLIQGFFLKSGVLFALGWSWWGLRS